ncbi:MAG: hypothetical protein FJ280_15635 [Planctomycetes bacterium]|nr:hypothetical protein [Planctomycetota bacterium]
MYELLLRIETLFRGVDPPVLVAAGLGAVVVGLMFWLGGTRYSAAIIGLLGAVVGSAAGLLIGPQLNLNPWLGMLVGAAVLAGLSILLKNVLIVVLAVLVFSAVSGAGYISVVLDRAIPPAQAEASTEPRPGFQYFRELDRDSRQDYLNDISGEARTFAERLEALLDNTWEAIGTHRWRIGIAVVVGAVAGILLVWLIAKIVIALAYSIVGTALLVLGAQAALLGAGVLVVSDLAPHRWLLPIVLITMTVVGWIWQLFYGGARKPRREPDEEAKPADRPASRRSR